MAKFILSNNYFKFSEQRLTLPPPYACIYMDEVETEFLQTQRFKPRVWLRFIDDTYFTWTHGEENLNCE